MHQVRGFAEALKNPDKHRSSSSRFSDPSKAVRILRDSASLDDVKNTPTSNLFDIGFISQEVLEKTFDRVWAEYLKGPAGENYAKISNYLHNTLGMTALPEGLEIGNLRADKQNYWKQLAYARSTPGLGEGQAITRSLEPFLATVDRKFNLFPDEFEKAIDDLAQDTKHIAWETNAEGKAIATKIRFGNKQIELAQKNADG